MRATLNKCGHPERRHQARGMCVNCYEKWLIANSPRYREYKAAYRNPNKADKCGHPELRCHAYGMCASCYNKWAMANSPRYRKAKQAIHQRASFKKLYGITVEHYEALLKAQGEVCAICGGTTAKRLSVDHCHTTGKVRGLLCGRCNAGIGQFKESLDLLDKAKAYLSRLRQDTESPAE